MASVKINALCNGKKLNIFSVSLNQYINWHHSFKVAVSSEWLEEKNAINIDNSVNFLGKTLELEVTPVNNLSGDGLNFKGIVTAVNIDRSYTTDNLIVLSGYSPTYLLEDGLGCKSYEEKSGDDIFNEIVANYPINLLNPTVSGNYKEVIPYMVRYKETNFHFLNRLATMYGEWLYYNGQNFVFGKMKDTNEVKITLGIDLKSYEYGVSMKPSNFEWLSNDYVKNDQFNKSSKSYSPPGLDAYGKKALKEAKSKFPGDYKIPTMYDIKDENILKQRVEISKSCIVSNTTTFNGVSTNPSLAIGTNLSVYANNRVSGAIQKTYLNRFRVIGVYHHINQNKDYQNTFEALPFESTLPPVNGKVFKPEAEKHTAIVIENNDPEELGRVRVQFNWQEGEEMTPWIRVSTAHAGEKRGVYFTPELGDEVIVDFEHNNPNKPYVCDTMYHGETKPEYFDQDNNFKFIKTRSGHTILLNDEEGKETITIADKNENFIKLNTEEKTITISAPEVITLQSQVINLLAGDKINLESKPGECGGEGIIKIKAENNINVESAKKDIEVDAKKGNVNIKGKRNVDINGKKSVKVESSMKTEVIGKTSVKVNGAQAEVKATAKLDLKGGALANLKAAIVKIN